MTEFAISPHLHQQRFILITKGKKIPTAEMNGWANNRETITLTHNNPKLKQHIENGGNYAITTNENLVIIACDTPEVEQTIQQHLPPTHTVRSPRHKTLHYYYYCHLTQPIHCIPSPQGDPVADIKHGNAYTIAAGSTLENYGQYTTIHDLPIATTTEQDIIQTLAPYIKIPTQKTTNNNNNTNDHINFPITKILPPGLTRIGNDYRGPHPTHGSTTGHNFAINTQNDTWYCFRHQTGGGSLTLHAMLEGIIQCEELQNGLRGDKFTRAKQTAEERGLIPKQPDILQQLHGIIHNKNNNGAVQQTHIENNTQTTTITKTNNQQCNIGKLITALKTEYHFKTPEDTQELHYYTQGIYKPAERHIEGLLETVLGEKLSTHHAKEIINHLKRDSYTPREQINQYNGHIPFQNCLLNIETLEQKPFTPEHFYTYKLNINYDPTATCPKFEEWLNEVQTPENITILQEYAGYCLLPQMPFHKSMWFIGEGRNGKSTYLNTIKNIIGTQNTSHIDLQDLNSDNRFILHDLYGKLVNISQEPETKKEIQTSIFKKLTGNDTISAELKNQQKRLNFTNYAKFYFSGNKYPKIFDSTTAFKQRIILIKWEKQFLEGQNQIQHIENRWLNNNEERSGIINWMLQGLKQLQQQGRFSTTKTQEQTMTEFERASDSATSWIHERTTYNTNKHTTREEAIKDYTEYCIYYGLQELTKNQFIGRLRNDTKIIDTQIRIKPKNERIRVWKGIELKTPLEQTEEQEQPPSQTILSHCHTLSHHFTTQKNNNINYLSDKTRVTPCDCVTNSPNSQPVLVQDPKHSIFTKKEANQLNNTVQNEQPESTFSNIPKGYEQKVCAICGHALMDNDWTTGPLTFDHPTHITCYQQKEEEQKQKEQQP